jgi:hypothetical protein
MTRREKFLGRILRGDADTDIRFVLTMYGLASGSTGEECDE